MSANKKLPISRSSTSSPRISGSTYRWPDLLNITNSIGMSNSSPKPPLAKKKKIPHGRCLNDSYDHTTEYTLVRPQAMSPIHACGRRMPKDPSA